MSSAAFALLLSAAELSHAFGPNQVEITAVPAAAPQAPSQTATSQPESNSISSTIAQPGAAPTLSTEADSSMPADTSQRDIVVTARPRGDPLRRANVASFNATQAVDDAVIGPAAHTYERVVPSPVRGGLRNFFYNLHEPTVFLNYLVQLKPGKAAETLGRFAVNTTIGVVGVVDIAKRRPFNLPRRPNSFSDTLGYYGVRPGPFLFLPLIGPTTLRDLLGGGVDRLGVPSLLGGQVGGTAYVATTSSIKLLDRRLRLDDDLRAVRSGPGDPYGARRALYLHKRQAEIDQLHGRRSDHAGNEPTSGQLPDTTGQGATTPVNPPGDPAPASGPTQRGISDGPGATAGPPKSRADVRSLIGSWRSL